MNSHNDSSNQLILDYMMNCNCHSIASNRFRRENRHSRRKANKNLIGGET